MVSYNNILKTIELYVEKCDRDTPTSTSGIIYPSGEAPKFEPKGKKLTGEELNTIADEMAERYGLQVSEINGKREVNGKKFILWDNEHNTEIVLTSLINRQDEVDFTNRGYYDTEDGGQSNSTYTLDEVLSYYNEMPNVMKDSVGGLIFKGEGSPFNNLIDGRINNPIQITHNYLTNSGWYNPKGTESDLQRVMYHEATHSLDTNYTNEEYDIIRRAKVSNTKYDGSKLDTVEERETLTRLVNSNFDHKRKFGYSNTEEYKKAMEDNDNPYASIYSQIYCREKAYAYDMRSEDFAETMSMVAMSRSKNSKNAILDGTVDINSFKKTHKATWKFCEDVLDGKITKDTVEKR